MRITSKGQVTIPLALRRKAGLTPNTEGEFELDGNAILIRPARRKAVQHQGAAVVARLRGSGDVRMSTDEIMALTRGE